MTEIEKMAKDYFEKEEYGPNMEPHIISAFEAGAAVLVEENTRLRDIGNKLLKHLRETDFDVCGTPPELIDEAKEILTPTKHINNE